MSVEVFIGLDGEMTGSGSPKDYKLIQIGVATRNGVMFVNDIGHDSWVETEQAMKVNGFTAERIRAARRSGSVDEALLTWLVGEGIADKKAVPVGWNVGSFDMPYVRETLPLSARKFGYRALDLNAVCFTIGEIMGRSWTSVKGYAKKEAARRIGGPERWHDAGYDALASIRAWDVLREMLVVREIHDHF